MSARTAPGEADDKAMGSTERSRRRFALRPIDATAWSPPPLHPLPAGALGWMPMSRLA